MLPVILGKERVLISINRVQYCANITGTKIRCSGKWLRKPCKNSHFIEKQSYFKTG